MTNGNRSSDFKIGQYSSLNLLYHPTDRITMGGEVQWIRRVNNSDGWEVTDTRVQLSFRYSFGESLYVTR